MNKGKLPISALVLRTVACLAMLLDHIGYCTGNTVFRCIGRLAFPLFVFLLVNGYRHTSCRWRYLLRLGVFALLSQIPYSLLVHRMLLSPQGNVFFTLLGALLCVWALDVLRRRKATVVLALVPSLALFALYYFGILRSDYGAKGLLLALVFYFCDANTLRGKVFMLVGTAAALYYANLLALALWCLRRMQGVAFALPILSKWTLLQAHALLALPLIWLYNGKRGAQPKSPLAKKSLQLAFYAFYPAHLLLLWLLYRA